MLGSTLRARIDLRETLGRDAYLYFYVAASPALTEDVRELAADADESQLDQLEKEASERKTRFVARVSARTAAREGDEVELAVDVEALHFFDPDNGVAIN